MKRGEAVNWLTYLAYEIGKAEHQSLWHYEKALLEIRDMLESMPSNEWVQGKEEKKL